MSTNLVGFKDKLYWVKLYYLLSYKSIQIVFHNFKVIYNFFKYFVTKMKWMIGAYLLLHIG
jgi:hypothetical protein